MDTLYASIKHDIILAIERSSFFTYARIDFRKADTLWFSFIYLESIKTYKQSIATINRENFDSMKIYLDKGGFKKLHDSIVLRLSGDKDSNKLLGIFFDDKCIFRSK